MTDVSKYFYFIDGSAKRPTKIERIRQVVNYEDVSKPYEASIQLPEGLVMHATRPPHWQKTLANFEKRVESWFQLPKPWPRTN